MSTFKSGKDASAIIGVCQNTLREWEKKGLIETIRTPGGKRLYNVDRFILEKEAKETANEEEIPDGKVNICYARVSTHGQKDDLEHQKKITNEKVSKTYIN